MSSCKALLALVPALVLVTFGARYACAGERDAVLFIHNAVSGDASLVHRLNTSAPELVELPNLQLGRWNVRIGVIGGQLLTLDTESHRIHAIDLKWLHRAASDPVARAAPAVQSTTLRTEGIPYRAVIHGSHVLVDYYADNRIETYKWNPTGPLSYVAERVLPSARTLGLSDVLIRGDQLLVAASGISCLTGVCPKEARAEPHVFALQLDDGALGEPSFDARPSNANSAGLFLHAETDSSFVINAGDYRSGHSSLQRIKPDGSLGPEIHLANIGGAAHGFTLDARTAVILPFSGEHVFLFDAVDDRVLATLRLDEQGFVPFTTGEVELLERPRSDLQDLVADPKKQGRFYIIDSKREQLLHVEFTRPQTLRLLEKTALRTSAYRSSPSWGLWVTAEN